MRWGGLVLLTAAMPCLLAQSNAVERGRYLVEDVAKCSDCHTPAGPQGPDKAGWLKGSELSFAPIQPVKNWHKSAPDLTPSGRLWQNWGEKALIEFLVTGKGPKGHTADPPMPSYRFKRSDAADVVAYLKTLK